MAGGLVKRPHEVTTVSDGIVGDSACCIFEFIRHEDIPEINHKIGCIFQLIAQTTPINGRVALLVKMWIGLNKKGKSAARSTLGAEIVLGAGNDLGSARLPVAHPVKIGGIGAKAFDQHFRRLSCRKGFPGALLVIYSTAGAVLDAHFSGVVKKGLNGYAAIGRSTQEFSMSQGLSLCQKGQTGDQDEELKFHGS